MKLVWFQVGEQQTTDHKFYRSHHTISEASILSLNPMTSCPASEVVDVERNRFSRMLGEYGVNYEEFVIC